MTRTIRRYQLPSPDAEGTILIAMPERARALLVEDIAGTAYLTAIVDETTPMRVTALLVRRANQEVPPRDPSDVAGPGFLGVLGINYFFWKGDP